MKEIGGYFELAYTNITVNSLHSTALKLNSGRNCLAYILQSRGYKKVYVPHYTCDVIIEQLVKYNIAFYYYNITENLEPHTLPAYSKEEAFLYVNYFGIKGDYIKLLAHTGLNLIIDNSQALFSEQLANTDTFYSLRKFAGVTDGAFLYCNGPSIPLDYNKQYPGGGHLVTRKNFDARAGFDEFKINEAAFSELELGRMSPATEAFITTFDFEKTRLARERNFLYLHNHLGNLNNLPLPDIRNLCGPLCYPFIVPNNGLRKKLIEESIFVPTFWPGLNVENDTYEAYLVQNLLPLPIDQRYELKDMQRIIEIISTKLTHHEY